MLIFTYGIEVGDQVDLPRNAYFDHDRCEYFDGCVSGTVVHVHGPITHIKTTDGKLIKIATVSIPRR